MVLIQTFLRLLGRRDECRIEDVHFQPAFRAGVHRGAAADIADAGEDAPIREPDSPGPSVASAVPNRRDLLVPVTYVETVASKATATVDLTFDIAASGADAVPSRRERDDRCPSRMAVT